MAGESKMMEVPIQGMDCAECTLHVRRAIAELPGVHAVEVFLAAEKAVVKLDPTLVDLPAIKSAVEKAGYSVGAGGQDVEQEAAFTRPVLRVLGAVFGAVLFVVVVGEWLGLFEKLTATIPWPIWLVVVLVGGYPVFLNVLRAARQGQILSHTLMSVGVLAALAVGEWATAAVVVFFMRVGDAVEHFTAGRARRAVRDLAAMAPQVARLEGEDGEVQVPVEQVQPGDVVVVRPGESIPVDGVVVEGRATVNQASITGEGLPLEAAPGSQVYAATLIQLGSLRVRATQVGADTTFGRVVKLVAEAEANRSAIERAADRFSAYYLPLVSGVALLTFLIRRDPLATAAVLVVACSCSFALATPIAMLAAVGASARRGLMIKGGKYLEVLARADVLLIDKTGTLTLGQPRITAVVPLEAARWTLGQAAGSEQELQDRLLRLAAAAERYSEHPLGEAVRQAAAERGLAIDSPLSFTALPGMGVRAQVGGHQVMVGNRRMVSGGRSQAVMEASVPPPEAVVPPAELLPPEAASLAAQGQTLLYVYVDEQLVGLLAAADTLRSEVPEALAALRALGIRQIQLLTGDREAAAAELAHRVGLDYRAELLPEDKINIVKAYQAQGWVVVMVGDGVNDAPALAQADVGIAMGAASSRGTAGSPVAIEAAHIALMRDDWRLVPEALRVARRTMGVVRSNIWFTAIYNLLGISLAAAGVLPPVLAAAAQSLPDLGILANSSRLLKS